jgi:hypothetical protein
LVKQFLSFFYNEKARIKIKEMELKLLLLLFSILGIANAQSPSFLWAKSAGGTQFYYDDGNSVSTDASGNVYVTGYFQSPTITFGTTTLTNTGGFDFFITKYDAGGNVLWAKSAIGVGQKDDIGQSISIDANGNVYVIGLFYSSSITFGTITLTNSGINTDDIFVVKYNSNGNVLWAKREGGTYYDEGKSISTDANGNVLITGNFSSSTLSLGTTTLTSGGMFSWNFFVVKYDSNGNTLWAKGAGGTLGELANSISADVNGNVFVIGIFSSPSLSLGTTTLTNSGLSDIFVVKYDINGNVLWAKGAGGTDDDLAYSVSTDANGNVFMSGSFKSQTISFGTTTLTNVNVGSYFVTKYDTNGNMLWAKSAGGTNYDAGYGTSADGNGNVYVTGCFYSSSLSFGLTTLTNANTGLNESDMFVVKYDANGNVLWAKSQGGIDQDVGHALSVNASGDIFVTGHFHNYPIAFGSTTLTTVGGSIFVAKLGVMATGINSSSNNSIINIFPNPCSSSTTLQVNVNLEDAMLVVYNSLGQVVKEVKNISSKNVTLSLDNLSSGTYLVRLTKENAIYTNKLVITDK